MTQFTTQEATGYVHSTIQRCLNLWHDCATDILPNTRKYSVAQRSLRGAMIQRISKHIGDTSDDVAPHTSHSSNVFNEIIRHLIADIAPIHCADLQNVMHDVLFHKSMRFLREVQIEYPEYLQDDIQQAIRNVWVIHLSQYILGLSVSSSPAVFPYGMLYPITDNLLDSPSTPRAEKRSTCRYLSKWLSDTSTPGSVHCISELSMMLDRMVLHKPRNLWPMFYSSLGSLNRAQFDAMLQSQPESKDRVFSVLELTFRKGAWAVVSDGAFSKRFLTKHDLHVLSSIGTLLQLLDDLQDLQEDRELGCATVFTIASTDNCLEDYITALLNYIDCIVAELRKRSTHLSDKHFDDIYTAMTLIACIGISTNACALRQSYLDAVQELCPIPIQHLSGFVNKLWPYYLKQLVRVPSDHCTSNAHKELLIQHDN